MAAVQSTTVLKKLLRLFLALGVLAVAACSSASTVTTADGGSGGQGQVPADFVRGAASLSEDICTVWNEPIAGVLHVEDLRAVGLLTQAEAYSSGGTGGKFSAVNYAENGQINCGADLDEGRNFYLELHRNGRGIAANYNFLSSHDVGGTTADVYANDGKDNVILEIMYPDAASTVGEASLLLSVSDFNGDGVDVDSVAGALLSIAEIIAPRVTYDPPAAIVPTPTPTPAPPSWWSGCDDTNFVFANQGPQAILAALGETEFASVKPRNSPLDIAWTVDCRINTQDGNQFSVETYTSSSLNSYSYDTFLADSQAETDFATTTTTILGRPVIVVTDYVQNLVPTATVFVEIDGVGVFIEFALWDTSGPYSEEAVRATDMAVAAATVFLSNF